MSETADSKPGPEAAGPMEESKEPSRARAYARFLVYAVAACGVLFIMLGVYQPEFGKKERPSWDDFQERTKSYQQSQDKLLELIQKKTGQGGE
ncbi:MAG: hypothetical protein AAF441_24650 [Pseudomonadota bacterium]